MKLLIDLEGRPDPVLAEVDARDRRAFERNGPRDLGVAQRMPLKDLAASQPETYTTWLAWHCLVRTGFTTERFPDFEKRVLGMRSAEEDEDADLIADPTALATSGG